MKTKSVIFTSASFSRVLILLAAVLWTVAFSSCSTKKNTAATRNYQAFITRYNIYFNGDEHFKETLKELESAYEDDYTSQLFMHPVEAYANPKAPQPQGSFTRSIEKAQKAIQLRSIKKRPKRKPGHANDPEYKKWLKREEYNPFLHNAWMLMGRSQYFNGDFLGAASTFYYVAKHFSWLPNTVLEAKLWQARSYCALDWLFEAETILTRIKTDELVNNTLRELYYFTFADFYIRSHDNSKAIPMLKEALGYAHGTQKTRLNFLLGQLYSAEGDNAAAYQAYRKAGGASSASYRTKFNARIKQSEVFQGADITPEVKALQRMTRYDRNKEYLDQIYYAIGNLYLSRRDTANAIANYVLAAEKSTRNGVEKAFSQITLGGLYFDRHRYDLAQPCYAEAVPLLPDSYPDLALLQRRSDVLDELAVYSQNVTLNDSLLRLAAMPEAERLAVIDKIISDLKKKEKEEAEAAKREEYLAQQAATGSNLKQDNAQAPTAFNLNTDKSWYFYNTASRNAGRTDFQKRWGSRKLENDWRRRNKASFSFDEFGSEDEEDAETGSDTPADDGSEDGGSSEEKASEAAKANDPHNREYYLKQIPFTDVEKVTAEDVIREGLYNSGLVLKDKLEDFDAADSEWQRLMSRYPDNVYRLDIYYNEYLMNVRRDRPAEAERYRQLILAEFPESNYAKAMSDPNYLDNLRSMFARQEALYDEAYADYLADNNADVHKAYERMVAEYPLSPLMPKFMFLHALAFVTDNKPDEFGATLKELLERYPETDVTPMASSYLKGLAQGRKLRSGGSNMRGMLWDIRLSNDSTATGDGAEIEFVLEPEEPHYLVLLFSTENISPNQLLFDVARHNFTTYMVRDFDLEVMNFGRLGLLLIKGFRNEGELNHYRSLLAQDNGVIIPEGVRPVQISKSNFEKLLQGGGSFDDYFRFIGEETVKATHESVLPPEEYPSAEEMYDRSEDSNPDRSEQSDESDESDRSDKSDESDRSDQSDLPVLPPAKMNQPDSLNLPKAVVTLPSDTTAIQPANPVPDTSVQPEAKPSVNPAPKSSTQPAPKKTPQPVVPKPKAKTEPKKQPVPQPKTKTVTPVTTPKLPDYPLGSEGDEDD
ncbi:tetratricopeptide repeat protein [uncultured Duncaniella sp.]|uniref:type IX secretion system periplasmic lipoprotein PorW/SprE n=1 Tax=uncultured Duncaniella sp. TaxID=2768039 RepID=UPI002603AE8D|nr:tetratricopeptide repeat protein [uncultured Duncaniella sp.]